MPNACKPILVGVASPVSEILLIFRLPSKRPKFPFGPWAIVHGGQKIESAQKFMQVEVDLKCMQTNFGGRDLFGFGDFAYFSFAFKTAKISLRTMGYSPWGSKNRIGSKNSCK